jgi:hypothetical protein
MNRNGVFHATSITTRQDRDYGDAALPSQFKNAAVSVHQTFFAQVQAA